VDPEKVAIFAVNLQEDEATVRTFFEKQKLSLKVAMDVKGKVGEAYGANSIPMTVIIGKGGTVQAVHVGFSDKMAEDLKAQLKTLLDGGTLVKAGGADENAAPVAGEERLEKLWAAKGSFTGLGIDQREGTFYAASTRKVVEFSSKGEKIGETRINAQGDVLRLANIEGDAAPEFVLFGRWGPTADAFDRNGEELWSAGEESGIDDVCAIDLTGDGLHETIIGFNGGAGVWALKQDGTKLWTNKSIGNVWHVTGGTHNGKPVVVTTSAAGKVHLFDTQGKKLRDLNPGVYANMVRLGKGDAGSPCVLVGGSVMGARRQPKLVRMDMQGKAAWEVDLPGPDHMLSMAACGQADYAAVGLSDGTVHVVDTAAGKIIATIQTRSRSPEVAWWWDADAKRPVLGVLMSGELRAVGIKAE
jgi:hypothetical protein